MTNISGWVTFREIIDNTMLSTGDGADMGQYMRKLNFAIKGYEKLRLTSLPATKSVPIAIDTNMRVVPLPDDFLKFGSVGIISGGKFYPFKPKSELTQSTTSDCGVTTRDQEEFPVTQTVFSAWYSLDIEHARIILDCPVTVTTVTLNYTPTGVKMDGVTYIPRMCADVIEAYIEWQCAMRDKVPAYDKAMLQNEYVKELMLFRGLQWDTDELFNELYEHLATGKQY